MILSTINIVFDRDPRKDPVTLGFEVRLSVGQHWSTCVFLFVFSLGIIAAQIALKYLHVKNPDFLIQPVSFAFVFTLGVTSVRGFILNLIKVCSSALCLCAEGLSPLLPPQMFTHWSSAVSSNSVVMFLAEVMGAYFISVVLLIRMAMPPQYRVAITDVIGSVEFNFFHRWSDFIFVFSAFASIVVFGVSRKSRPGSLESAAEAAVGVGAAQSVPRQFSRANYERYQSKGRLSPTKEP